MSRDYFIFAKAVLWWAVAQRRLTYQEFNRLSTEVRLAEYKFLRCNGKVTFDTYEAATQVGDRVRIFHKTNKKRVPYHCAFCGKWHLADAVSRGQVRKAQRRMKEERLARV